MKKLMIAVLPIGVIIVALFFLLYGKNKSTEIMITTAPKYEAGKKVLYIDSYHKEYAGSLIKHKIIYEKIKGKNIELRMEFLDSKRVKDISKLESMALDIKKRIDRWRPDVIIAMDDAASKYIIMPYFKDSKIPVIFAGVNWTVGSYGYSYKNTTGQIEIELIKELFNELTKLKNGKRFGFLSADTLTNKKNLKQYQEVMKIDFKTVSFVSSFEEWKKEYKKLQNEVDILFLRNSAGIKNWDSQEALSFEKILY
jgi:ABC-type uncharacterized transport system substrate-binding protein